jgi:hypothetical protein
MIRAPVRAAIIAVCRSSMSSPQPAYSSESLAACAIVIAGIFTEGDAVWITEEFYEANGPQWRVTLVCPGERGGWAHRRYRYDIPSGTLYFTGATPAGDVDLAAARRAGRRLYPGQGASDVITAR